MNGYLTTATKELADPEVAASQEKLCIPLQTYGIIRNVLATFVGRSAYGKSRLNDVLPRANPNGQNIEVWRGRDRFGIEAPDVTFILYWDRASGLSVEGKYLYASAWRRPDLALVAVVNRGEPSIATVHIDLTKFGLGGPSEVAVTDADSGEKLQPISGDETISVPVGSHDYRQLLLRRNAAARQ